MAHPKLGQFGFCESMTTRGRRSQQQQQPPRFRTSFSIRNLRSTLTGVALGIGIGSVSVLFALGKLNEEEEAGRGRGDQTTPGGGEFLQHEALRYGLPSSSNVHVRSGYVVSYDYRTRNASWVLEYLTRDSLRVVDDTDRTKSNFTVDALTPEPFRVHPNLFFKSGYDKGHLAPARDMTNSQQAMNESFLMTNISPQVGVGFNRGYWSRFEGFVRHLAGQFDGVYVVTGPLFLPTKNKKTGEYQVKYPLLGTPPDAVAVPTHFFKVVLGRKRDGSFASAGFILPNRVISEKKELTDFLTPINVIEKHAGLLFFDKVRCNKTCAYSYVAICSLHGKWELVNSHIIRAFHDEQLHNVEKVDLCRETKCALAAAAYRRVIADK